MNDERERLSESDLQHRVRGVLALVRSVFGRTTDTGESLEEVNRHFQGRLDVIGRHPLPSTNDLERLVRDEFRDFRFGYDPAITIEGPEVDLLPDQAFPLALAIHELVTNSLKFGALSQGGHVDVRWSVAADAVELRWEEAGVRVAAPAPLRRGFGHEFIEDALPFQLNAETSFALRPGGLLCTIRLPRER